MIIPHLVTKYCKNSTAWETCFITVSTQWLPGSEPRPAGHEPPAPRWLLLITNSWCCRLARTQTAHSAIPMAAAEAPVHGGNSREPRRKFYMRKTCSETLPGKPAAQLPHWTALSVCEWQRTFAKQWPTVEDGEEERPRWSEKLAWFPSGTPLPRHRSGDVSECNTNIQSFKVYDYFFKQQLAC